MKKHKLYNTFKISVFVTIFSLVMAVKNICCAVSLTDVVEWYHEQIPLVNDFVYGVLKNKPNALNTKIEENKFYFANDGIWYDCHYTVWYNSRIDGVPCKGEMRIFLRYMENNPVIWTHSIFDLTTRNRIAKYYDERYEKIIEDYYKYLVRNYS